MTDEDRPDGSETDWLAWTAQCYGYGYTPEQALNAMAFHLDRGRSNPLEVDLVEHVGGVKHGRAGYECDHEVAWESVTFSPDQVGELIQAARAASETELILESARMDD